MMDGLDIFDREAHAWLAEQFGSVTTELEILLPHEWAEKVRYLPPSVTPMPGYYSFDVAPYLIEIVDNGSPYSEVQEIDILKGVQTGFTVGVLENVIGYGMHHIKDAPMMLVTADKELAKIRMDTYIRPMINHSQLDHLIKSHDEKNTRKTGNTDSKIEWEGGGFLMPFGAKNADKLRSVSIQYLLLDEIDAYPERVGNDGDPLKLAFDRTSAYETKKKVFRGSTPLITQTSKAWREYNKGDQREYRVPCKHCGEKQKMIWHGETPEKKKYGIDWDLDEDGILVPGSVRYICRECGGLWENDDKTWMYRERGKYCEWVPTTKPIHPRRRSYHISALYSPVGMKSWESQVLEFLDAWDVEANKVKDIDAYQQFRNNVEGLPFELRGQQLKYERVIENRRTNYVSGVVPNKIALKEAGSRILILVASVDVHKKHLDVLVEGYCRDKIKYSIDWFKIEAGEGETCENLDDPTWQRLRDHIEEKIYKSDDGHTYQATLTVIDSQFNSEVVYNFCNEYGLGVIPVAGVARKTKGMQKEFQEFNTKIGTVGMHITVDNYKDRLATKLNQSWSGRGLMRPGQMNYPANYPDKFFKELTLERKVQDTDKVTGQKRGFRWHRPGNADNHAWDLSVYCAAAIDMVAYDVAKTQFELEYVVWKDFWDYAETGVFTLEGVFSEQSDVS